MQVRAISKQVRMSPRKVRLIADAIRKLSIEEAFLVLSATQHRAAQPVAKTLESAVANAVTNNNLDRQTLVIESVTVNEGQAMKRFHPSSRGRVHPYKKKSSHITIILGQKVVKKATAAVKPAVAKEDATGKEEAASEQPVAVKAKTKKEGGKK